MSTHINAAKIKISNLVRDAVLVTRTNTEIRPIKLRQLDLLIKRRWPKGVLDHACEGGEKYHDRVRKKYQWNLGRV